MLGVKLPLVVVRLLDVFNLKYYVETNNVYKILIISLLCIHYFNKKKD